VGQLHAVLDKLTRSHLGARMAGLIVDSSGWVDSEGYEALVHAAEVLGVDTFVVMADDRLYSRLSVRAQHRSPTSCKLARTPCATAATHPLGHARCRARESCPPAAGD
jgi:predicted nucleotidyltransferase